MTHRRGVDRFEESEFFSAGDLYSADERAYMAGLYKDLCGGKRCNRWRPVFEVIPQLPFSLELLVRQGYGPTDIGLMFGVDHCGVLHWLNSLGLSSEATKPRLWSDEESRFRPMTHDELAAMPHPVRSKNARQSAAQLARREELSAKAKAQWTDPAFRARVMPVLRRGPQVIAKDGLRADVRKKYQERAAMRTHCVNRHELTPGNTYNDPRGVRQCKACRRAAIQRHQSRRIG